MTRIVAITAGLSEPSTTRMLADRLVGSVTRQATTPPEVTIVELRRLGHDLVNNLATGFPAGELLDAVEAVRAADAIIAVTPVFSASYSGLFKMFFDVLDEGTLTGTPVLIAATAGTPRHSLVLEHALRPLFSYLRAIVAPTAVFAATEDWGDGAAGHDLQARIDRAAAELLSLVEGSSGSTDDGFTDFASLLGA